MACTMGLVAIGATSQVACYDRACEGDFVVYGDRPGEGRMVDENTWESGVSQNTGNAFEYAINANWAWYGNQTMTSGVWQHIATTWDGTTVTQYLNANGSFTRAQGGQLTGNATGFGMGCRGVSADGTIGSANSYLNGSIDEAYVYNRALTAAEVLNYYNSTK